VKSKPQRLPDAVVIAAGALAMCWPAFLNGFPLLFTDSINYLNDGRFIRDVLLGAPARSAGWMRSPVYSLLIYPFHWGINPWPVLGLQALVTAWMLWRVVRSLAIRRGPLVYLALVGLLSLFTGLAWVVSRILPDMLCPVLCLGVYLLMFAPETLSRLDAVLVSFLVIVSIGSHPTHRALAAGLCALFGLALLVWPRLRASRAKPLRRVSALLALAIVFQVALNGFLTGVLTLDGPHPPFLMARLVADGPARHVLERRCGELQWVICKFKDRLPADSNEFLWGAGNVMASVRYEEAEQLRREELPLLWATLRDDPVGQARISLGHFGSQLVTYGLDGFGGFPWTASAIQVALPAAADAYRGSRQARQALPTRAFSAIQRVTIPVAVLMLAVTLPYCWRRGHTRLLGLGAVLLPAIVGNAFLTGVFSLVDARYQLRLVWLLPLLAGLVLLQLLEDRRRAMAAEAAPSPAPRSGRRRAAIAHG